MIQLLSPGTSANCLTHFVIILNKSLNIGSIEFSSMVVIGF